MLQNKSSQKVTQENVWPRLREEAEMAAQNEPLLAKFFSTMVLHHDRLEQAVVHRVGAWLDSSFFPASQVHQLYNEVLAKKPELKLDFEADLLAVLERDPACRRLIEPFLY